MSGPIQAVRLPHRIASGAAQMDADAALLAWAAGGAARVVFRTYGWSRATLSLGRGETFPEGWAVARIEADGVDVVRRPTGGDAVLHDDELTFAVAASLPGAWRLSPRGFADAVAEAVAEAVSATGVAAERVATAAPPGAAASAHELACFARAARGEVRAGAFKIAGLASRFARGAALCHVSLPLGNRYRDVARYRLEGARDHALIRKYARSLGELAGDRAPDADRLGDGIAAALEARLGARFAPAPFSAIEVREP
jgi:lipoate-protein ligase A